jgi:hypothetical protein
MSGKPKTPTASGVSRLLASHGFKRSDRNLGGFGNGYATGKSPAEPGTVLVRHRFWSAGGGNCAPWLAKYAEAIDAAGFAVRTDPDFPRLIVTAKTEA